MIFVLHTNYLRPGVLQGCVLVAAVYSLYINDAPAVPGMSICDRYVRRVHGSFGVTAGTPRGSKPRTALTIDKPVAYHRSLLLCEGRDSLLGMEPRLWCSPVRILDPIFRRLEYARILQHLYIVMFF